MKTESGRSLIEMLGVLAITGMMTAGAIWLFTYMYGDTRMHVAMSNLARIAQQAQNLKHNYYQTYANVSIDKLIADGSDVVKDRSAPIGGPDWSIEPMPGNDTLLTINLTGLSQSECEYIMSADTPWAAQVVINGTVNTCYSSSTNNVSFIVE